VSLQSTFIGILAVAVVLLFCVSAALLREILVLRERTARLMSLVEDKAAAGTTGESVHVEVKMTTGWLLAVDSSCGFCHEVVEVLGALRSPSIVLLSYEDPKIWAPTWPGEILTDRDTWARLAPFTPPALFKIGAAGLVEATRLPLNGADAVRIVSETTEPRSGANQYA
jgi:hypothetical protein